MISETLTQTPLLLAGVFVFGLLIGSFLNVVILRLPVRMEHDWRVQARELLDLPEDANDPQPPGLALDRSRCPHCGHNIRAHENIPLLSYVFLLGKCSACKARISPRYPIIELVTGLLFMAVIAQFGLNAQGLAGLVLTSFLVALTVIDLDHQYLPDSMTLPLLWIGLLLSLFYVFTTPSASIIGAIAGYGSFWLVFHGFKLATGKEGMGFGDFKLLAALGAWLGWQSLPLMLVLSSFVGAVVGIALIVFKSHAKEQPIPFGPFIAAAGWSALMWGDNITSFYLGWM